VNLPSAAKQGNEEKPGCLFRFWKSLFCRVLSLTCEYCKYMNRGVCRAETTREFVTMPTVSYWIDLL